MKVFVVVALTLVALAAAAPQGPEAQKVIAILKSEFDQQPQGAYSYQFETENGINRSEQGDLKSGKDEEGNDREFLVVRGSYSYPGPDGNLITVNYVADENGFHPEGDSIPKPNRR